MGRKTFVRIIVLAAAGATLFGTGCATNGDKLTPEGQERLEQAEKRAQKWERVTNPGFDDINFVIE
jgi:hypothetical protein